MKALFQTDDGWRFILDLGLVISPWRPETAGVVRRLRL